MRQGQGGDLYEYKRHDSHELLQERDPLRYSDAYEVYGLTRTGCCGCPISYKAVEDLDKIGKYEPMITKAAWNIFGDSYRYRQKYNEYKAKRMAEEKQIPGQMSIMDFLADTLYG